MSSLRSLELRAPRSNLLLNRGFESWADRLPTVTKASLVVDKFGGERGMSSLRSLELRAARSAIEPAFASRVRIVG